MKFSMKAALPAIVMVFSLTLAGGMISARRAPTSNRPIPEVPLVGTVVATAEPVAFTVTAHGTVAPRTESDLVSEISGRIDWVSPRLQSGAFFAEGDMLLRIESSEYEANLEAARAAHARAEGQRVLARASLERERSMRKGGAASKAQLDEAIFEERSASASVRETTVAVGRAERDLERCTIRAPYAGRVREKIADVGQFVARGSRLARVYSVDYAEIRLPIHDDDLAFLELPMGFRDDPLLGDELDSRAEVPPRPRHQPEAHLSAHFAGERHTWVGHVVRSEGTLDPKTRMITVVARVDDPYGRSEMSDRPPLAVGLFVEARIRGRTIEGLVSVPRSAILSGDRVAVVGPQDQLDLRPVEIVRAGPDRVWVRPRDVEHQGAGLIAGERVCTTTLPTMVSGMQVRSRPEPGVVASARETTQP